MARSHDITDQYDTTGWSYGSYDHAMDPTRTLRILQPLIAHLQTYDYLRQKLETRGGTIYDITALTEILNATIPLGMSDTADEQPSLSKPKVLGQKLRFIDPDIYFHVSIGPNDMPLYFLCRVRRSYEAQYGFILQDLYISPGHPRIGRFVKLSWWGQSEYFLHLAQFRNKIAGRDDLAIDAMLFKVGFHILESAWHEDQQVAMVAAENLNMPNLKNAIELVYLGAGGELSDLRAAAAQDPAIVAFFRDVYPQPAITAFLGRMAELPGDALVRVQAQAVQSYARLGGVFSGFLSTTTIPWGMRQNRLPLYKLLLGNFSRFDLIAPAVMERGGKEFHQACMVIEAFAQQVTDGLLAVK